MREATIQRIATLDPIPGADRILLATLEGLGWTFVVGKNDFKVGDACVYFQIDSQLPADAPWAKFLADKGNTRIKSMRFRGALSQGLALPVSILMGAYLDMGETTYKNIPDPDEAHEMSEITCVVGDGSYGVDVTTALGFEMPMAFGFDVTDLLGVTHYEKPLPVSGTTGSPTGKRPGYTPYTDETMLQNIPGILKALEGQEVYVTVKCDGTSSTFASKDGEISVCGRNWAYHEFCMDDKGQPTDKRSLYWQVFRDYGLDKVLAENDNIAIQAEIVGPGIQRNRLGFPKVEMRVFDVWDIKKARYYDFQELAQFCVTHKLPMVPVLEVGVMLPEMTTVDYWLDKAKGVYDGTKNRREGIVIRACKAHYIREVSNRASFKALNNDFLVKDED